MPLTTDDLDRVVRKLGMQERAKKHRFVFLEYEGKHVVTTARSHGRGDLGRVEFAIRKQLHVNGRQLTDLVNCPMTREAYIQHLKDLGVIEPKSQE